MAISEKLLRSLVASFDDIDNLPKIYITSKVTIDTALLNTWSNIVYGGDKFEAFVPNSEKADVSKVTQDILNRVKSLTTLVGVPNQGRILFTLKDKQKIDQVWREIIREPVTNYVSGEFVNFEGGNLGPVNGAFARALHSSKVVTTIQPDTLKAFFNKAKITIEKKPVKKKEKILSNTTVKVEGPDIIAEKEGEIAKELEEIPDVFEDEQAIAYWIEGAIVSALHRSSNVEARETVKNAGASKDSSVVSGDAISHKKKKKAVEESRPRWVSGDGVDLDAQVSKGNLAKVLGILNQQLRKEVLSLMGSHSLQNRTGRFASSARVTAVYSEGIDEGSIVYVKYEYDRKPYQIFEYPPKPGLDSWATSADRDPRRIITSAIRNILITTLHPDIRVVIEDEEGFNYEA